MNWRALVFLAVVGFGGWQYLDHRSVATPAGVMVSAVPRQTDVAQDGFALNGYSIQVLQAFDIQARILGVKTYRMGREADLSPVDLALGWGPMSDSTVLSQIRISQGNRFYFWRVDSFPVPREDIERSSANMHMIPADARVRRLLSKAREGQVVHIEGWLVEASAPDGWRWRSSLTRNDTGPGACELIYVRDLRIL